MKTKNQDIDFRDLDAGDLRKIIEGLAGNPENRICKDYLEYCQRGLLVADGKLLFLREKESIVRFETFPLADLREALPIFTELVREFRENKKPKARRFCSIFAKGIKTAIDWLEWHEREAANQRRQRPN